MNKKRKLVFLMDHIITGGIEKVLLEILDNLKRDYSDKYEISVVVAKNIVEDWFKNFCELNNIEILILQNLNHERFIGERPKKFIPRKIYNFKADIIKRWRRKILKNVLIKKDVVLIDFFNCTFSSYLKYYDVPKIGWYHSCFNQFIIDNCWKEYKGIYNKIVCISDDFLKKFSEKYPKYSDDVLRIYNPINIKNIIKNEKVFQLPKENEKYFVFVGRLHFDKDHETLIKAFSLFIKNNPDGKLYLLGEGPLREKYENIVKSLNLENSIIFKGSVLNPLGYIKNSVANILSSFGEGLSQVLLEAAVVKTLNIASNCPGGVNEVLYNGKAGILYEPGNYEELANIMDQVWNNKIDKEKLINAGTVGLERFNPDKIIKEIDNLISKI